MLSGTAAGEEWLFKAQLLVVVKSLIRVRSPLRDPPLFTEGTVVVQRIFRLSRAACNPLSPGKFGTWGESCC